MTMDPWGTGGDAFDQARRHQLQQEALRRQRSGVDTQWQTDMGKGLGTGAAGCLLAVFMIVGAIIDKHNRIKETEGPESARRFRNKFFYSFAAIAAVGLSVAAYTQVIDPYIKEKQAEAEAQIIADNAAREAAQRQIDQTAFDARLTGDQESIADDLQRRIIANAENDAHVATYVQTSRLPFWAWHRQHRDAQIRISSESGLYIRPTTIQGYRVESRVRVDQRGPEICFLFDMSVRDGSSFAQVGETRCIDRSSVVHQRIFRD